MAETESRWQPVAWRRRATLATLVLGQTAAAVWLLTRSLPAATDGVIGPVLLAVSAILFTWIGLGFWTAAFGFLILRRGGDPFSLAQRAPDTGSIDHTSAPAQRVAVVMPICHEPVQQTLSNLKAVYQDLEHQGALLPFDFYVLSDSRDPEVWLEERAACADLASRLGARGRLFYRRRRINLKYKSGNIADFLRRWGSRYRYMIVLDADSLLSADAMVRMLGLMEQNPRVGILQTAPRLGRARTRFARLQQFASRAYGRMFSAGLAALQLGDANYWGHNAILRVEPFMAHCGLRQLRGLGLFRGPVLSHDYLESALIGRAGYEIWLEPAIAGSYEESPPTLEDDLIRDRRWCRGNLQHLVPLLTLGGLRFAHRLALLTGILAYLASPLWLLFLGLSGYLAMVTPSAEPALPGLMAATANGAWSAADTALVALTVTMLLGPRLLALLDQALAGRLHRFGGAWRLAANTLIETLVSLVLAPIRMITHTGHVIGALTNRTLRWQGQNRSGVRSFQDALRYYVWPALACAGVLVLSHWHHPELTPWVLPVAGPVLLAPIMSLWLAALVGERWMTVPEHLDPPPVMSLAEPGRPLGWRWPALSWFEQAVLLPAPAGCPQRRPGHPGSRKQQHLASLIERCVKAGPEAVTPAEQSLVCEHPDALQRLHFAVWHAEAGSPWGLVLARLSQTLDSLDTGIPDPVIHSKEPTWIGVAS
ncbi:MAG TPA: glucans biosynthesis glucosyltransferase MdoH [Marinobacter sp.]|nr:glucans biosynthesis glucosyltransferase MdoH [Marinobacter sp.]